MKISRLIHQTVFLSHLPRSSYFPRFAHGQAGMPNKPELPGVKQIVAVASGKGGVGKSTTAVNLAIGFTQMNQKVALLDADIYGPSIPMLMNLRGLRPEVNEKKLLIPLVNYGIKCMSMGFLVEEDSPTIWRGPMVMGALEQLLRQVEWGDIDTMVIDLPPGTGDAQLSLAQRIPVNGAIIVCTPQDLALLDAVKGTNMFRKVNIPIFGIVENMSYFECPKCQEKTYIFGKGGAKRTADELNVNFLGEIPLDPKIRETSDSGRPISVLEPKGTHAQMYRSIAQKIQEQIDRSSQTGGYEGPKISIEQLKYYIIEVAEDKM